MREVCGRGLGKDVNGIVYVNFETKRSEVGESEKEVSLAWNSAFRKRSHCYEWF